MTENVEIQLRGVKKKFAMGEVEVSVLHGIDLEIYAGELIVILGASGSGKSTLMNLIGGIDRASDGEILFRGSSLSSLDDYGLTEYRKKNVGFIFQFYNLIATLTAKENVEVATEIATDPMPASEALIKVGLETHLNYFPSQLSGEQQQRVSIARAIAKKPNLMLCDEPTGALDHDTGQMILDLLIQLNKDLGTTIILITHDLEIAKIADRIVHLGSGVIDHIEKSLE